LPYTNDSLTSLPADTYYVSIIDSIGCSINDTVIVLQPSKIEPNALITHVLCHDDSTGSIVLSPYGGVGGYSYNWWIEYDSTHYSVLDSSSNHIMGMIAGIYRARVTDSSGCYVEEDYEIRQPAQISLTAVIVDNVCYDGYEGSIDLTVEGGTPAYDGYTYIWSEQNDSIVHYYDSTFTSTEEDLYNLHAGTYTVTVTDLNGCQMTETYQVSQPFQGILLEGEVSEVSCKDQHDGAIDLTVTYGTPPYTYLWSNGSTEEDLDSLDGGTYIVTVTDIYGCFEVDTFVVPVNPQECLHVYNAFSPNGDGVNDTWEIDNIYLYPQCVVKVYNQWGNMVFYSDGYTNPWDGTYNGKPLPSGTYYYVIDLGNGDVPYKGDVTIIR
jgi:gliding motility-associated-like protein